MSTATIPGYGMGDPGLPAGALFIALMRLQQTGRLPLGGPVVISLHVPAT